MESTYDEMRRKSGAIVQENMTVPDREVGIDELPSSNRAPEMMGQSKEIDQYEPALTENG